MTDWLLAWARTTEMVAWLEWGALLLFGTVVALLAWALHKMPEDLDGY